MIDRESSPCRKDLYPDDWPDPRPLSPRMWEELAATAVDLQGPEATMPIRLEPVCRHLGISIVRRADVEKGKAYLVWRRERDEHPVIHLPAERVTRWDRFCIAHELAHFLLISRYEWHPRDQSRYWETEALCDFFARELLLPMASVRTVDCASAEEALASCNSLGDQAKIPWIQTAKKLSETNPLLAFFKLGRSRDGRLATVATSLPREKGRGVKLNSRAGFVGIAESMALDAAEDGRPLTRRLSRNDFLGGSLGRLFGELSVDDIVTEVTPNSVKLAVTRSQPRRPPPG